MKLIIDLPEEDFGWNGVLNICHCSFERLIQIVSEGTPLEECEPCTDAISREAVLDAISELNAVSFYEAQEDSKECYYEIKNAIKQLSPVNPIEKTGYWTNGGFCGDYICSVCKNEIDSDVPNMRGFNFELPKYCPKCGAKMQEV